MIRMLLWDWWQMRKHRKMQKEFKRRYPTEGQFNNMFGTSGVDTWGCDCGHNGMGHRWHRPWCAWASGEV